MANASRNGTGGFDREYDWTDDAGNSIAITASRFDEEMDGVASELTNSVAADGQTTMTGALKMGTNKITGLATGVAATDGVTLTQVETLIADAKAALYPVGSYYMNETVSTNPATLLGFGTWVAVLDKFIVARGSTYTSTGGAATVALIAANNGPHTHNVTINDITDTGTTKAQGGENGASPTIATSSSGSGTPFSIIPPYQAAYIWKRTV